MELTEVEEFRSVVRFPGIAECSELELIVADEVTAAAAASDVLSLVRSL